MPGKKEKEELTAEEYRQKAQEQIHELKDQWKIFFRTGIIILAAVIVIIAVSIAWFAGNDKVDATGAGIQAAGSEFELAAAGKDADSTKGAYDDLLKVSPGARLEIENKSYLSTDGSHTAISWSITDDSNMRNESGQTQGIEPGSSGKMTFYIISHKEGLLDVKLDLDFTGYQATVDPVSTENLKAENLKEIDESAQQLLEGHILLFAGYDEGANSYKGWISEDAGSWSMNLGTDGEPILLQEDGKGGLTWKTENAKKDKAYPVTVYWIWPERLESYLRKADTYTGRYPLLFPEDTEWSDTGNPSALPANLFTKMCETGTNAGSNRYFRWENQETFTRTVTADTLKRLRNNFHSVIYREAAAYYDSADQYLGKNVQYVKLKLTAE